MNLFKKLVVITSSAAMILTLASCGSSVPAEWTFKRDDCENFAIVNSLLSEEGEKARYTVNASSQIFLKTLDKDGFILYNYAKAYEESSKNNLDFIDYSLMKKYEVEYSDLQVLEDNSGFNVLINKEDSENVYGFVRQDYSSLNGTFIAIQPYEESELTPEEQEAQRVKEDQEKFEKKYASQPFNWETGGRFVVEILSNIGGILAGIGFDTPTASVVALFNILMSFGNFFGASGPTIQDVLNKLKEMDVKLNQIIGLLEENHRQLLTETARTQALVDKVVLEQQNAAITQFTTDYLFPIDNFNRSYSVNIQENFKLLTSKTDFAVDVHLYKNSKNEWCSRPLSQWEIYKTDTVYTVNIPNFSYARARLESDNFVIKTGFIDELYRDIDKSLVDKEVPEGINLTNLRYFASANITEQFNKDYFSQAEHKSEAQNFANLLINTSKRYSGTGSESIVKTYCERLKYMYNFGAEIKKPMTTYLSSQLYNLDINVAKASQYLAYAQLNDEELEAAYKAARKCMTDYSNVTLKELPDNYSFITSSKLQGNLFGARYIHKFTTRGNFPNYECTTQYNKFTAQGKTGFSYKTVKIEDYTFIDNIAILRINFRLTLLKQLGLVKADRALIDYLDDVKIMEENILSTRDHLVKLKVVSDDGINRFATNISYRDMDASKDRWISMYVQDKANDKARYFTLKDWVNYHDGGHDNSHWSGRIMEADFVDAKLGALRSDKFITAKATYRHTDKLWVNDEDWLFATHDPSLKNGLSFGYFFLLTNQK